MHSGLLDVHFDALSSRADWGCLIFGHGITTRSFVASLFSGYVTGAMGAVSMEWYRGTISIAMTTTRTGLTNVAPSAMYVVCAFELSRHQSELGCRCFDQIFYMEDPHNSPPSSFCVLHANDAFRAPSEVVFKSRISSFV